MPKTTCPRCGSLEVEEVSLSTVDDLGESEGPTLYKFCFTCELYLLAECWKNPGSLKVLKIKDSYFVEDYYISLDQYSIVGRLRLPYTEEGRITYALSKIARARKVEELVEFLAVDEEWIRKIAQKRFEELGGK